MIDSLPLAMVLSLNATQSTARSALPGAPVVPDAPRRPARAPRSRAVLAAVLTRAARRIEPGTRYASTAH